MNTKARQKLSRGKCSTKYCRGKRVHHSTKCPKCRHRRRKETDFVGYVFDYFKQNAKRRGKCVDLTKAEFTKFVTDSEYLKFKGKTKFSLSIDRIRNEDGYTVNNIRAITLSENSSKRNNVDYSDVPF